VQLWKLLVLVFVLRRTEASVSVPSTWDATCSFKCGLFILLCPRTPPQPSTLQSEFPSNFFLCWTSFCLLIEQSIIVAHDHAQWHTREVGLLWTRDRLIAKTSTWQHSSHKRQTSMPPAGFEPETPASWRPDPRLRPRDHWNRFISPLTSGKFRFFRHALYWCFGGGTARGEGGG